MMMVIIQNPNSNLFLKRKRRKKKKKEEKEEKEIKQLEIKYVRNTGYRVQ